MQLPSAYTSGYAKARSQDQALADSYIAHTLIGDPELDPVLEELSSMPRDELHRFTSVRLTEPVVRIMA